MEKPNHRVPPPWPEDTEEAFMAQREALQRQTVSSPSGRWTTNTVNKEFASTLNTVDYVESVAFEVAQRAGFHGDSLDQISLAVRETTANAVIHGNRYSTQKKVLVAISVIEAGLKITIADEGDGFDAETLPDPLAPEALLKDHGRGIYLSRTFMDEYHVHARKTGATEVTLIKYFQSREPTTL